MARFTVQRVQVATGSKDQIGLLFFVDDRLAALFVRLDDDAHGGDHGRWFLEAGFGCHATKGARPLESLRAAIAWVANRVEGGLRLDECEIAELAASLELGTGRC